MRRRRSTSCSSGTSIVNGRISRSAVAELDARVAMTCSLRSWRREPRAPVAVGSGRRLLAGIGAGLDGGQQMTRGGLVGRVDEDADSLQLELGFLATGVVRRHGGPDVVVPQEAGDQFGLDAAGDDGRGDGGRHARSGTRAGDRDEAPGSWAPNTGAAPLR